MRHVGRIVGLWRYLVKSMAPEPIERVEVGWHGLAGDRRWAFVRGGQERNGFPWLTQRESPELARYQPRLVDPARPNASAVHVRTPAGRELDVADPALADELGSGARVIKLDRGAFDTLPISVISTQTIARLGALVGREPVARRFRPNVLVDGGAGEFPEDEWVGHTLQLGAVRVRVDKRDQRCVVVNLDPDSGERDPQILRTIGRERDACLGVYGSVVTPGELAIGDAIGIAD